MMCKNGFSYSSGLICPIFGGLLTTVETQTAGWRDLLVHWKLGPGTEGSRYSGWKRGSFLHFILFTSLLRPYLIRSKTSLRGGMFSDHRYPFHVCLTLPLSGSLSVWVTKIKACDSRSRGEVNLGDWFTCLNADRNLCNTSCGPHDWVSSFHSSSVSYCLRLLFSVRVTGQLATSIKVRDPINSHWLSSHPPCRRTQVVLLLM